MQKIPALNDPSEAILLMDWNRERSTTLLQGLSVYGLNLQWIQSVNEAAQRRGAVVLIPAAWPSETKGRTLDTDHTLTIVRELRGLPGSPEMIVFGCGEPSMNVTELCRYLLEGARHLVEGADPAMLASKIASCLEGRRDIHLAAKARSSLACNEFGLVYGSEIMHQLLSKLRKAALVKNAVVLLIGPTGSGKQKLAESVHCMDPWRGNAPMVTLNCATITASLAESELFGHRRGSYTGATVDRMGCFRAANGGTLVLDEIGELDLSLQPKLLRALEERKVRSLGQDTEVAVDVRLIATTNRDLRAMVAEGSFRMDLYQRLAMVEIFVPPLACRSEDLLPLIKFFIHKHRDLYNGQITDIHPNVIDVLSRYPFEGNVRELENLVRYIMFNKSQGETIQVEDLSRHVLEAVARDQKTQLNHEAVSRYFSARVFRDKMSLSEVLEECESIMLKAALDFTGGNRSAAAGLLRISERTLYNKLHHCTDDLARSSASSSAFLRQQPA
jgi:transcriptional regulator with PAS, ATPase and Fis domain